MNTSDNNDVWTLLDELSSFSMPAPNTRRAAQDESPLKPEDVQQYFLDKTKVLVETSIGAVQDLTPGIVAGSDAKEIEALSKLMASASQALEALQKTALIDKKADRDEKLEKMRFEAKKEMIALQGPQQINNNQIFVASREEIMKKLFGTKEAEVLEIDNK